MNETTVTEAIDQSILRDEIVWLESETGLHAAVSLESEDHAVTGGNGPEGYRAHVEYWGECEDRGQWRIHVYTDAEC